MLIPAGIPLLPKPTTSSEVKSGRKNVSFSYSRGHGRSGRSFSALETSVENLALISLFTTATNPAGRRRSKYRLKIWVTLQWNSPLHHIQLSIEKFVTVFWKSPLISFFVNWEEGGLQSFYNSQCFVCWVPVFCLVCLFVTVPPSLHKRL